MSCPGLHCPGCSGGQSLGIAAAVVVGLAVADRTIAVVAENIIPIAAIVVVCFALSVAASTWLEARTRQREVAWGAAHGIYSRADFVAPYRQARHPVSDSGIHEPLTDPGHPAIAPGITVNIFGVPTSEQAAIICQAIPGHAGPAITSTEERSPNGP